MTYEEFLKSKHQAAQHAGFEPGPLNPVLKDFQADGRFEAGGGPDRAGAWAGLCDWLMEECLLRLEGQK